MLVGVSTGVLYPYTTDVNKQIDFFRKSGLEIDGLELLFSRQIKPRITKENEEYAFKNLNLFR